MTAKSFCLAVRRDVGCRRISVQANFVQLQLRDTPWKTFSATSSVFCALSSALFWDVESLRSGDKWKDRLAEEVVTKDVFYLFWSQNSVKSEWVNWEWQCAYEKKGIDYIDPIPLDETEPPAELKRLQFADLSVRHLRYEQMKIATSAATN